MTARSTRPSGTTGATDTKRPVRLDPDTGTLDPARPPRRHPGRAPRARLHRRQVLRRGGWGSGTGGIDAKLEIYDPVGNTWSTGAPAPRAYAGSGSAVLDGKLYMVGGCGRTPAAPPTPCVYDPADRQLVRDRPLPGAHLLAGLRRHRGPGSTAPAGERSATERPCTPTSTTPPPTAGRRSPTCRSRCGGRPTPPPTVCCWSPAVVTDDSLLTNQGFAFDPLTGTWSALPNANVATLPGRRRARLLQGRRRQTPTSSADHHGGAPARLRPAGGCRTSTG